MTLITANSLATAQIRVRASGARVTDARVRVLALLINAESALSHQDVLEAINLDQACIDRVTVYRVLDWLTEQKLAHRIAAEDRVYRFSAQPELNIQGHGHFQCEQCQKVFCMQSIRDLQTAVHNALPPGFQGNRVELSVHGLCLNCLSAN